MQTMTRIPRLTETSYDGALIWFAQLHCKGLLFHLEDDPSSICSSSNDKQTCTETEVAELRTVISVLETSIGHDAMIEAAYLVFLEAVGIRLDA